jgi:hypothetical protein
MIVTSPEFQIQSPETVAKRALAMSAYCCRGYIDTGKGNADAESVQDRMIQWLTRFNLVEQLGSFEWDAIRSPLGSMSPQIASRITWEIEGLAVLTWAIERGSLPEHDSQSDPYAVTDSMHFLAEDADHIIVNARLRGTEELRAYRDLMYAIHCRLRDFLRNGGSKDFTNWIEPRWLEILGIGATRLIINGDLGFKGQPISVLENDQLKQYEWGIREQHRASIWLVGEDQNYWETNADT